MPQPFRLAALLSGLALAAADASAEPTEAPAAKDAKESPAATLSDFGGPEEGFTARMPGPAPKAMRNKVTIPAGQVVTAAWSGNVDGVIYSLSLAEYPEKLVASRPPDAFINEGRDGLVNQLRGKVVKEESIRLADRYPGKAFTVSSENGDVGARVYLVGPRLYTLITLYNPAIGAPHAEDFLRSLKLTARPPVIKQVATKKSEK